MTAPTVQSAFIGDSVVEFLKHQVEPAVYNRLDTVFPEFGWQGDGDSWIAKGTGGQHLDFLSDFMSGCGAPRAGDRVQCYRNSPGRFTIHGGPTILWTAFVLGRTSAPKGKEFVEAVRILALRAGVEFPGRPLRLTSRNGVNGEELRTYVNRLLKVREAFDWFTVTRGFDPSLIRELHIGFSEKGTTKASRILRFPILGSDGRPKASRTGFYLIPGVSIKKDTSTSNGWAYGSPPGVYYAWPHKGQEKLLIVEGFKDAWAVMTLARGDQKFREEWLLVTGTSGTALPPEFLDPQFFRPFKALYFGFDSDEAGERAANRIISAPGVASLNIDMRIVRADSRFSATPNKRADWNDLLLRGEKKDLLAALAAATVRTVEINPVSIYEREVDIQSTYYNGALYYPTERHSYRRDPVNTTRILAEEIETVVVKSTGELLTARTSQPITPGVTRIDRFNNIGKRAVLRLTDNTMVFDHPRPLEHSTWRQPSWEAFVNAKKAARAPACPSLAELIRKIILQLESAVWLPKRDDYALLALGIAVSYAQQIFDAVPMFLCVGEPGTGKSELGIVAASMGCNGTFLPKATASSFARSCDSSRGFVSVDDFEELGPRAKRSADGQFEDIHQLLKLSYKKETGHRVITENLKRVSHSVYGVKLINNTQGVDPIIASRMFKIVTRKIPENVVVEMKRRKEAALGQEEVHQLRDYLHTWVFSNVALVNERYRLLMADKTSRHDEIAAPLVTLAQLSGDAEVNELLSSCLQRRLASPMDGDLANARNEAFYSIVRQGYTHISSPHFSNELVQILPHNYGKSHLNEIPEHLRPHAVGKWLSNQPWIASGVQPVRPLSAEKGRLRAYPIDPVELQRAKDIILKRGETVENAKDPNDFCRSCDSCVYRAGCVILTGRQVGNDRANVDSKRLRS